MKSPSELVKYGLGPVILILILGASLLFGQKHKGIEFGNYYAAILPSAKISSDDAEALNRVLKKYDKAIYRIETFEKGRLVKTHGTLSRKYIREGLVSEVARQAKATKFTGWAVQAGVVQEKVTGTTSSTHPTPMEGGGNSGSSTHPTPGDNAGSSTHPTPGETPGGSSTHPTPGDSGSSTHPTPGETPGGSSTHPTPPGNSGSSTHPTPGNSGTPGGSSTLKRDYTSSTTKLVDASEEMLKEVRPILEKYNKE